MANVGDTGNGATFAISGGGTNSGLSVAVKQIEVSEETREMLDVSVLGTSGDMIKIGSDLKDPGDMRITYVFLATATQPASSADQETATVTFPIGTSGNTTNATLAGTGCLNNRKLPDLANGQVMEGQFTFTWDGDTGPTYTVESA